MNFITLKNLQESKLVKDVIVHPLKVNKDASGILVETLRTDWNDVYGSGTGREFAMQYYSVTPPNLARDEDVWHHHPTQEDRFLVAQGEIIVAVGDNREGSATKGLLNLFYMHCNRDPYLLLIPKQTLHGFLVVSKEPAVLLNFPTKLYNPQEEGRIPHDEVKIMSSDGDMFFWQKAREEFPKFYSSLNAEH